ncbi:MAG: hypothetical protein L3K52_07980 [Candidatus Thiothrix sulfatifontis]|nr:MAG: hypothetical protein L3K52_07980 [Candidatus Thiothrix sulfatifontis]
MDDINTNQTVDYSQARVIELMRSMNIENKRILLKFVDTMIGTQPEISPYAQLTAQERIQELFGITTRMKSHAAILGQFFVRPTTKKTALEGMDTEISNMLVLWELVKADLEVQS